jgi:hypothetical protein
MQLSEIDCDDGDKSSEDQNCFCTAVKIVHEFSHLAHLICGERLERITRKRSLSGDEKISQIIPEKEINGVIYFD